MRMLSGDRRIASPSFSKGSFAGMAGVGSLSRKFGCHCSGFSHITDAVRRRGNAAPTLRRREARSTKWNSRRKTYFWTGFGESLRHSLMRSVATSRLSV